MKIKTKSLSYDAVMALPRPKHLPPKRPNRFFRTLVRLVGRGDLRDVAFSWRCTRMEDFPDTPALILMNHSSFLDLEIAAEVFADRPYCIVCTSDGFVGKPFLMRQLGCIPTKKFVTDLTLVSDIRAALRNGCSVLMFPEASYSFDGTATPLPRRLGVLLKRLAAPVISVRTFGAFARDPLYNCLQKRKVHVSAEVTGLLTPDEIREASVPELDAILDRAFTFDHFAWQRDNKIEISEPFRADGLHRILYKCPVCGAEARMHGEGVTLTCGACGKKWTLDRFGVLVPEGHDGGFSHIPDWYRWERDCVRDELGRGEYRMETPVVIRMVVDYKAAYTVGTGTLIHDASGFTLTGCEGKLCYRQPPQASYGLYADYYWYELGDVICIGDSDALYYCFPEDPTVPVAKARLAAEELYKLAKSKKTESEVKP